MLCPAPRTKAPSLADRDDGLPRGGCGQRPLVAWPHNLALMLAVQALQPEPPQAPAPRLLGPEDPLAGLVASRVCVPAAQKVRALLHTHAPHTFRGEGPSSGSPPRPNPHRLWIDSFAAPRFVLLLLRGGARPGGHGKEGEVIISVLKEVAGEPSN